MVSQGKPIQTITPQGIHFSLLPTILQSLFEQLESFSFIHFRCRWRWWFQSRWRLGNVYFAGTARTKYLHRKTLTWCTPFNLFYQTNLQNNIQNLIINFPRHRGQLIQRIKRWIQVSRVRLLQSLLLGCRLWWKAHHITGSNEISSRFDADPRHGWT